MRTGNLQSRHRRRHLKHALAARASQLHRRSLRRCAELRGRRRLLRSKGKRCRRCGGWWRRESAPVTRRRERVLLGCGRRTKRICAFPWRRWRSNGQPSRRQIDGRIAAGASRHPAHRRRRQAARQRRNLKAMRTAYLQARERTIDLIDALAVRTVKLNSRHENSSPPANGHSRREPALGDSQSRGVSLQFILVRSCHLPQRHESFHPATITTRTTACRA
jgi:hypothetical protein